MSMSTECIMFVGFFDFPFFEDEKVILERFNQYLIENTKDYYFIVHDSDKDTNGQLKTMHVHFLYKKKNKCVVATELNSLTMYLFNDMKLRILITIDKCKSFDSSLRYLVHRDNEDKYQYKWDNIKSNISVNMINAVLEPPPKPVVTIEYLWSLINKYHACKKDIYAELGLEKAMKYRGIIEDLIRG